MISIIACIDKNRGIGYKGQLLYKFKDDLETFKKFTIGHCVIMGHNTFTSLGKPLKDRTNIVVTKNQSSISPNVYTCNGYDIALDIASHIEKETVYIIGGASAYSYFIDRVDELILTEVDFEKEADTFFPEFNKQNFRKRKIKDGEQDGIKYTISRYTRKS